MQDHYNLIYREEEREMLPLCLDQGVGVIPWSPLARGRLTRPWDRQTDPLRDRRVRAARSTATRTPRRWWSRSSRRGRAARGVSPPQVALAWLLAQPAVTSPIVGVTKPEHLDDAVAAVDLELSPDEVDDLSAGYLPHAVTGHQ